MIPPTEHDSTDTWETTANSSCIILPQQKNETNKKNHPASIPPVWANQHPFAIFPPSGRRRASVYIPMENALETRRSIVKKRRVVKSNEKASIPLTMTCSSACFSLSPALLLSTHHLHSSSPHISVTQSSTNTHTSTHRYIDKTTRGGMCKKSGQGTSSTLEGRRPSRNAVEGHADQ